MARWTVAAGASMLLIAFATAAAAGGDQEGRKERARAAPVEGRQAVAVRQEVVVVQPAEARDDAASRQRLAWLILMLTKSRTVR